MAHAMEAIIREAYSAFARGDLDGYFRACSEDWNFNIAGEGAIAGVYRGKQGL
jgi:ketosteroid isomerase-like protein